MQNSFMKVHEVAEVLGVSNSYAYRVIGQLNAELKKQGYITIAGRVNRSYFYERIYRAEKGEAYAGIPK